jgi:hypothetical protein
VSPHQFRSKRSTYTQQAALANVPSQQIAPLKYRHIGGAAGSFGEWLFSFITVFAGGIAIERIGWKIWIWQVVACFVVLFFVYFMCPEVSTHFTVGLENMYLAAP